MAELDRRVTLNIEAEGTHESGRYVPGPVTPHAIWARRIESAGDSVVTVGGVRNANIRTYRIRWRADAASIPLTRLHIVDGRTFNVTGLRDPEPRNRFLELDVEAQT